jgi:hypothetical protein
MDISSDDDQGWAAPDRQYPFESEDQAWDAILYDRILRGELCRRFKLVPRSCDKPAEPASSAAAHAGTIRLTDPADDRGGSDKPDRQAEAASSKSSRR